MSDSEIASVGHSMFKVVFRMLEGDIYDTPDEITEVFEAMLADAALLHGWWQDSEGRWYRPIVAVLP